MIVFILPVTRATCNFLPPGNTQLQGPQRDRRALARDDGDSDHQQTSRLVYKPGVIITACPNLLHVFKQGLEADLIHNLVSVEWARQMLTPTARYFTNNGALPGPSLQLLVRRSSS